MKHIYLNLKRFDISVAHGGVNRISPMADWGASIVRDTQETLKEWPEAEYVMYFPEAHLLGAVAARCEGSPVKVGCQGVYRADTAVGGNFGAFLFVYGINGILILSGARLDFYKHYYLIFLGYYVYFNLVEFQISFQDSVSLFTEILGCPIFSKGTPISVQGAFVLIR